MTALLADITAVLRIYSLRFVPQYYRCVVVNNTWISLETSLD